MMESSSSATDLPICGNTKRLGFTPTYPPPPTNLSSAKGYTPTSRPYTPTSKPYDPSQETSTVGVSGGVIHGDDCLDKVRKEVDAALAWYEKEEGQKFVLKELITASLTGYNGCAIFMDAVDSDAPENPPKTLNAFCELTYRMMPDSKNVDRDVNVIYCKE